MLKSSAATIMNGNCSDDQIRPVATVKWGRVATVSDCSSETHFLYDSSPCFEDRNCV
jgi:hypothetical protein